MAGPGSDGVRLGVNVFDDAAPCGVFLISAVAPVMEYRGAYELYREAVERGAVA